MDSELKRLLWRLERGAVSASAVRDAFVDQVAQLVERKQPVNARWTGIAGSTAVRHAQQAFDKAVDAARRQLTAGAFRESLRHIEAATDAIATLELAAAVRVQMDEARRDREGLAGLTRLDSAAAPTSLGIVDRLLERSDHVFGTGDFRQSAFIAAMAQHEIERLGQADAEDALTPARLRDRCHGLRVAMDKCRWLGWTPGGDRSDHVLREVERLIDGRYYAMAERILDDLHLRLADTVGFVGEVERQFGVLTRANGDAIVARLAVSDVAPSLSPGVATERLLELALRRAVV